MANRDQSFTILGMSSTLCNPFRKLDHGVYLRTIKSEGFSGLLQNVDQLVELEFDVLDQVVGLVAGKCLLERDAGGWPSRRPLIRHQGGLGSLIVEGQSPLANAASCNAALRPRP